MHLDDSGKGVRGSEKKQASKLSRILCGLTLYKCIVHWRMCLLHFSTACNFEFLFRNELIKTNHTKENKRHTHTLSQYSSIYSIIRHLHGSDAFAYKVGAWDVEKVGANNNNDGNKAIPDEWNVANMHAGEKRLESVKPAEHKKKRLKIKTMFNHGNTKVQWLHNSFALVCDVLYGCLPVFVSCLCLFCERGVLIW